MGKKGAKKEKWMKNEDSRKKMEESYMQMYEDIDESAKKEWRKWK